MGETGLVWNLSDCLYLWWLIGSVVILCGVPATLKLQCSENAHASTTELKDNLYSYVVQFAYSMTRLQNHWFSYAVNSENFTKSFICFAVVGFPTDKIKREQGSKISSKLLTEDIFEMQSIWNWSGDNLDMSGYKLLGLNRVLNQSCCISLLTLNTLFFCCCCQKQTHQLCLPFPPRRRKWFCIRRT